MLIMGNRYISSWKYLYLALELKKTNKPYLPIVLRWFRSFYRYREVNGAVYDMKNQIQKRQEV